MRRFESRPYASLYLTFYIFVLIFFILKSLILDKILDCIGWCGDRLFDRTEEAGQKKSVIDFYNEIYTKFLKPLYATSIDNVADYHPKVEKKQLKEEVVRGMRFEGEAMTDNEQVKACLQQRKKQIELTCDAHY